MEEDMKRAIVIGGSLGGLLAANMLRHAGWRVDVFERVGNELAERGAGVVTHAELESAFRRVGIEVGSDLGIAVPARITLARDGTVISERAHPQVLTAWGRLYSLLKEHFPSQSYHLGKQVATVHQQGGTVTADFTDGSTAEADLLVAADGIRSTVRQQFLPAIRRLHCLARSGRRKRAVATDACDAVQPLRLLLAAARTDAGLPGGRRP
jgi:2-polyprenyl-6-methoxyphenol hydroxylase-like FAD-dependent oxidoreductase